jgi:hypothetical protein
MAAPLFGDAQHFHRNNLLYFEGEYAAEGRGYAPRGEYMKPTILAATMIAALAASILLAIPALSLLSETASAHPCQAEDPATSCGECKHYWYGGTDRHEYNDGSEYCEKNSPTPRPMCGKLVVIDNMTSYQSGFFCPP